MVKGLFFRFAAFELRTKTTSIRIKEKVMLTGSVWRDKALLKET